MSNDTGVLAMPPRNVAFRRCVVGVDFHDTLYESAGGSCNQKTRSWVNAMWDQGHFIVIYTSAPAEDEPQIKTFLQSNSVKYDVIETGKMRFDVLIDDCTIHPRFLEVARLPSDPLELLDRFSKCGWGEE